ncbi:hypothetical protein METSCH_B05620 [Metschnikowia aff. pulcherrima]|uniref:Uncharacterized protein n=1 Tax=Metschnikowia aff. pulcherrima TaxID=2163413 RepID=A0A4P6XJJ6_9ASCO|nr:hypothetical protein METSCH_B05620 [Metschnikowia aff. pulcherrima]
MLKPPLIGKVVLSSPKPCIVVNTNVAVTSHAITIPPGPPVPNADPEPTKRPVPIDPPIAIICKWRFFNFFRSCELAALKFAFSTASKSSKFKTAWSARLNESLKFCHVDPFPGSALWLDASYVWLCDSRDLADMMCGRKMWVTNTTD